MEEIKERIIGSITENVPDEVWSLATIAQTLQEKGPLPLELDS